MELNPVKEDGLINKPTTSGMEEKNEYQNSAGNIKKPNKTKSVWELSSTNDFKLSDNSKKPFIHDVLRQNLTQSIAKGAKGVDKNIEKFEFDNY